LIEVGLLEQDHELVLEAKVARLILGLHQYLGDLRSGSWIVVYMAVIIFLGHNDYCLWEILFFF
jgi:hypothetical protein